MIELTLAHSPDPDDAFMWWPLTGKISPEGVPLAGNAGQPAIDTGRFRFRAFPADIEALNRRAVGRGDLDITALSVRCYADVKDRYAITRCGASFGDGFGPKVVCRAERDIRCEGCLRRPGLRIAIPGRRTTAFLLLGMILGDPTAREAARFVEMPFEQIIGAVSRGEVDAGLVIHEGQLTFADAGLRLVIDVGAWWKDESGLKLPLGINAVRRDLDSRFGPGTLREVGDLLRRSVSYAAERRRESVEYTMDFARANVARGGGLAPTFERIDAYCRMYVSEESLDMGDAGRASITRLLGQGASLGLCPHPGEIGMV